MRSLVLVLLWLLPLNSQDDEWCIRSSGHSEVACRDLGAVERVAFGAATNVVLELTDVGDAIEWTGHLLALLASSGDASEQLIIHEILEHVNGCQVQVTSRVSIVLIHGEEEVYQLALPGAATMAPSCTRIGCVSVQSRVPNTAAVAHLAAQGLATWTHGRWA